MRAFALVVLLAASHGACKKSDTSAPLANAPAPVTAPSVQMDAAQVVVAKPSPSLPAAVLALREALRPWAAALDEGDSDEVEKRLCKDAAMDPLLALGEKISTDDVPTGVDPEEWKSVVGRVKEAMVELPRCTSPAEGLTAGGFVEDALASIDELEGLLPK